MSELCTDDLVDVNSSPCGIVSFLYFSCAHVKLLNTVTGASDAPFY